MITLAPSAARPDPCAHLARLGAAPSLRPFDPAAVAFVRDLSRGILRGSGFRAFPELLAMAHALRPVEIDALGRSFAERRGARMWLPRGTALHFAPANVDTIFVHSWVLSMLAGNANVVRLSTRRGPQVEALLDLVRELLDLPGHAAIAERTLLVSYEHDRADATERLSAACDLRVIWGGDATVRAIRAVPLPPRAAEVVFADRFSVAALDASSVALASAADLERLAHDFANDAFWFDQRACSSPRLVAWVGAPDDRAIARDRFWPALTPHAHRHEGLASPAAAFARLSAAAELAARGKAFAIEADGAAAPMRARVRAVDDEMREIHEGFGLFYELELDALDALGPHLHPRDQTLATFGLSPAALRAFIEALPHRALDRVVPVGQALQFSPVWDGYDLLATFTREVSVTV